MNTWLLVDYGGVLADDHLPAGEDKLADTLGAPAGIIRHALSERSASGRALRLDKISESEFWQKVAIEVNVGSRSLPTPEELTQLWANCYAIRLDVAELLREIKSNGVRLGLATNVDRYREKYLLAELDRHSLALRVWASYSVGIMKPDANYFKQIAKEIFDVDGPSNCLYVDDRQSHVDAALSVGWRSLRADRAEAIRTWLQKQDILK